MKMIENIKTTVLLIILGAILGCASVYIWGSNPNMEPTENAALSLLISSDAKQINLLKNVIDHLEERTSEQSNKEICLLMQLNIAGMKMFGYNDKLPLSSDVLKTLSDHISNAEHVFQIYQCKLENLNSSANAEKNGHEL